MRNFVRSISLFAAGIVVGVFLMQPSPAQQNQNPGLRLNHVGIYAKDYDETMRFYTQTVGLREAFSVKDQAGKPSITYLQINKDTFLEVAPATAERPAGLSHIGIWPDDFNKTIAALRQHGVTVSDPRAGSTGSTLANVTDPNGIRLELVDLLPGSLPKKAIDSWK
jgi:catechol 2,3-dioxygenase-like lactoylglutathione lyase family enzyme